MDENIITLENLITGELIRNNINQDNIDEHILNIRIYILNKSNMGSQIHFKFERNFACEYYLSLQYYENFIRKIKDNYIVSLYGCINNVISQLVLNEISKYNTSYGLHEEYYIMLENNTLFNKKIPNVNISKSYLYYKEPNNSTFEKCPVCLNNYDDFRKIKLNCAHYICATCYATLVKINTLTCPTCREMFSF